MSPTSPIRHHIPLTLFSVVDLCVPIVRTQKRIKSNGSNLRFETTVDNEQRKRCRHLLEQFRSEPGPELLSQIKSIASENRLKLAVGNLMRSEGMRV